MSAPTNGTHATNGLNGQAHTKVTATCMEPDDDMETSIIQAQLGQSALRAVRDLTVGEKADIGAATLNELKREDLGNLLTVINDHLEKHLASIERGYDALHRERRQRMQ